MPVEITRTPQHTGNSPQGSTDTTYLNKVIISAHYQTLISAKRSPWTTPLETHTPMHATSYQISLQMRQIWISSHFNGRGPFTGNQSNLPNPVQMTNAKCSSNGSQLVRRNREGKAYKEGAAGRRKRRTTGRSTGWEECRDQEYRKQKQEEHREEYTEQEEHREQKIAVDNWGTCSTYHPHQP